MYTYPGTTSGTECHDSAAGAAADLPLGNSAYTIYAEINNPGTGAEGIVGWGSYRSNRMVNAFRMGGDNVPINYWCVLEDNRLLCCYPVHLAVRCSRRRLFWIFLLLFCRDTGGLTIAW